MLGNKGVPMISAALFGKNIGVEYGIKPTVTTMGAGASLNTLTGLSEEPPLHLFGADECECKKIRENIRDRLGNVGHVLSGLFF